MRLVGAAWQSEAMLAYSQGDNARAIQSAVQAADLARKTGDKRSLAVVLAFQADAVAFAGRSEEAAPLLEEALAAARDSGDDLALGLTLGLLGQAMAMRDPSSVAAREYAEEGAALLEKGRDRWSAVIALLGMAMGAKYRGDFADARLRFTATAPLFHELGDRHRSNMVKSELAHIDRYEGHLLKAEAAYRDTILEWKRLGHRAAIAHQLECFASIALALEDAVRAARLFGAAEALREKIGIAMTSFERIEYDRIIAGLRAGMDDTAFSSSWSQGSALSMDQAIATALQTKNGASPPN
jgi:hypothetical protein